MKIGNKEIGVKPYIIAEFGVNHNGSLERAKEGIVQAAIAGCDAIKFQTYTADELVVKGTPKFWDAESKVDEGLDQYQAYKALEGFKYEWYPELMELCDKVGIDFISTPFSFEAATFLNSIGMKAFKIASSDMSCIPFLKHVARFGKPIILSTGASTQHEVLEAIWAIEAENNYKTILLQCTLKYPCAIQDLNLNVIQKYKDLAKYPAGLSDHTLEVVTSSLAVAAGAVVLEKHFTVDKTLDKSADHWLSLDPKEMAEYVKGAHMAFSSLGDSDKGVLPCEEETRKYDKRSIVSACPIAKGTVITEEMLTYKRPGTGIWPKDLDKVVGKKAAEFIPNDTTLQWTSITE